MGRRTTSKVVRRALALGAAVLASAALVACGSNSSSSEGGGGSGGGSTNETIKIGQLVPLTGSAAETGQFQKKWAAIMEQQLTAPGGPLEGHKLDIITYDTKLDPATAGTLARRLITRDHVSAISCCLSSDEAQQVAAVGAQYKVPIVGGAVLPDLTTKGNRTYGWYFLASPDYDQTIQYNVDYAKHQGWKKVGISYSSLSYGTEGLKSLTAALDKAGIEVVASTPIAVDATEATGQASKLAGAHPDGVLVWDYPTTTAVIIRDLRTVGYNGTILTNWSAHNPVLFALAGKDIKGVVAHTAWDPQKPYTVKMDDLFEQKYGKRPSGQQPNIEASYLKVIGLGIANALKASDSTDGAAVQKGLLAIKDYPASKLMLGARDSNLTFGRSYVKGGGQNPYDGTQIDSLMMEKTTGNGGFEIMRNYKDGGS